MRTLIITSVVVLCYWVSASAKEPVGSVSAGEKKSKSCMACHHNPISLKERGIDEIAKQIKAIRAGDKAHPPGLAELTDQDILDMATFLNDG